MTKRYDFRGKAEQYRTYDAGMLQFALEDALATRAIWAETARRTGHDTDGNEAYYSDDVATIATELRRRHGEGRRRKAA